MAGYPYQSLHLEEVPCTPAYLLSRPVYIVAFFGGQRRYLTAQPWSTTLRWTQEPNKHAIFIVDTTSTSTTRTVLRSQRRLRYIVDEDVPGVNCLCLHWPSAMSDCPFVLRRGRDAGLANELFAGSASSSISVASTPTITHSMSRSQTRYVLRSIERPDASDVRSFDGSSWVPPGLFSPMPSPVQSLRSRKLYQVQYNEGMI
ncbi:hypothetical protein ACHHYP_20482 [Achlya hypogyna]|uniref:Uncharacterized protein n=1 Tax=Achlya hypogyna TaxID=1202772 RepID=A0A1V9YL79_ACHHY|nr:hypothetical protein ACHHYP_20482 [Achlya hypogyna]